MTDNTGKPNTLLTRPLTVVNVGLEQFTVDLAQNGARAVQVAWQPPARGNAELAALVAKLGV